MKFKIALLASAVLLVASCGGGTSNDGGSSGSGGTGNTSSTGNSCQAQTPAAPPDADVSISSSFDAPMLFLAQPGPITATLLATPAPDPDSTFRTYIPGGSNVGDFTSNDRAGKTITTAPIPRQPPGVPLIALTEVQSLRGGAEGTDVMTGWPNSMGFTCCDGRPKARAQIEFGANNTAIVTFGGPSRFLPDSWTATPLRIQLTNVAACSM